jgi:glucosamine kinase
MAYAIGIDGGGTSTRARLCRLDGTRLGEGRAGPSGLLQGTEQAWQNIERAIGQAALAAGLERAQLGGHNTVLGLGLAGANEASLRQHFLRANRLFPQVRLESDAFVALLGAHAGQPGAIVIAGTGSVGHALLADGRRAIAGGWGFPSGDEGSGAWLGLRAVNLAQRALDGRHPPSALARSVLGAAGGSHASLLAWSCQAGQAEFASLAPLVFDCAPGDRYAAALLRRAVAAIAGIAHALDRGERLPLTLLGSVGQRLAGQLPERLRRRLVAPRGDAMDGALALCFH